MAGKQLTPEQDQLVYGYLKQGYTFAQVAIQLGCSIQSIYDSLERNKVVTLYNVTIKGKLEVGRNRYEDYTETRSFYDTSRKDAEKQAKKHWRAVKNATFNIAYGGVQ